MKRLPPAAIVALVGVAALIGLLAYGLGSTDPDRDIDDALAQGEAVAAPELELDRLGADGRRSLSDYRGRVVVLNVWASWCDPCREESPLLQRWHERIARDGEGLVLGIDSDDATADALAFVREYGLTYPMLRDPEGDARQALGAIGYPETFVVDRRGRIVAARRGPVDDEWLRANVAPLLGRS